MNNNNTPLIDPYLRAYSLRIRIKMEECMTQGDLIRYGSHISEMVNLDVEQFIKHMNARLADYDSDFFSDLTNYQHLCNSLMSRFISERIENTLLSIKQEEEHVFSSLYSSWVSDPECTYRSPEPVFDEMFPTTILTPGENYTVEVGASLWSSTQGVC